MGSAADGDETNQNANHHDTLLLSLLQDLDSVRHPRIPRAGNHPGQFTCWWSEMRDHENGQGGGERECYNSNIRAFPKVFESFSISKPTA